MESFTTWVIAFSLVGFTVAGFIASAVVSYFREEGFWSVPIDSATK